MEIEKGNMNERIFCLDTTETGNLDTLSFKRDVREFDSRYMATREYMLARALFREFEEIQSVFTRENTVSVRLEEDISWSEKLEQSIAIMIKMDLDTSGKVYLLVRDHSRWTRFYHCSHNLTSKLYQKVRHVDYKKVRPEDYVFLSGVAGAHGIERADFDWYNFSVSRNEEVDWSEIDQEILQAIAKKLDRPVEDIKVHYQP